MSRRQTSIASYRVSIAILLFLVACLLNAAHVRHLLTHGPGANLPSLALDVLMKKSPPFRDLSSSELHCMASGRESYHDYKHPFGGVISPDEVLNLMPAS